jgi:hypothetical protein
MIRFLTLLVALSFTGLLNAGSSGISYLEKAEILFHKVWNLYRVPEHGLFAEYYPGSHKPDLTYFQEVNGRSTQEVSYLWPMSGVFSTVNILMEIDSQAYRPYLDSMVTAVEMYYDTIRSPPGYQAYPVVFEKVDRYYDDNGLVGIDYIDAFNITHDTRYLKKAKEVLQFILSGWCDDFGGGVSWLEGVRDQKPACTNGKATVLCLKLFESTNDKFFLEKGVLFYNWMMETLEEDSIHIIMNSLITTTGLAQKHYYTYNTGTMIQSSVRLYKITGERKYLENAQRLSKGSHDFYVKHTESGLPYINDLPWFIVVLLRGYHELFEIDGNRTYVNTIMEIADHAWINARDQAGLIFNDWTGRKDEMRTPKWLLDQSCMAELYARLAIINGEIKNERNEN